MTSSRNLTLSAAVALALAAPLWSADATSRPAEAWFPYGAMHMSTISRWQHFLPSLEEYAAYLDRDLANMRSAEFNSLAIHVDWCDIEPHEGQFHFERLDKVMDLAEKHGLKVLLWPWPELQPEWVIQNYPDAAMIASDLYRPDVACFDHPRVRRLVERFVETVVKRYRDRASVLGWDLGAEAGNWVAGIANPIDSPGGARLYCYCEHTAGRYRAWLRRKYGTIEALNRIWSTYHRDFDAIRPLRTGVFERAQIHWLDWREFMLWDVADFQRLKADAARRMDARHPITAHIGGWGYGHVHSSTDEYAIGKHFDVLSLSLFPYWLAYGTGGWYEGSIAALQLDGVRSAADGKPMWVEELQGGPSVRGLQHRSQFPRPNDIRLWVWQSVAHGATAIFYWNWRPETTGIEASGFGLVNYDGSMTDRARAAGELSSLLNRHAALLDGLEPAPARIAVFHAPRNEIQAFGEHDQSMAMVSLRGLYRALWRANLPVDILVPEQLLSRDLGRYKIIYLPFAYTLSPAEGEKLKAYVEAGGCLYGETWCAQKDDRTFLYETVPGGGLADAFHVREETYSPPGNPPITVAVRHAALGDLAAGAPVPVHRYQQQLAVMPGGEVLAKFGDGKPAIVSGQFGKGKTLYVATLLCRGFDQTLDGNALKVLLGAAAWAGVSPPVDLEREPSDALVEARLLVPKQSQRRNAEKTTDDAKVDRADGSNRRLLILLNHSEVAATVKVALPGLEGAKVSDLATGERQQPPSAGRLSISLPPADVRTFVIE